MTDMSDSHESRANSHFNKHHLNKSIVLYDATCRLCVDSVRFLKSKNKQNNLLFYPLQSEIATIIFKYYIKAPVCDSVILIRKLTIYKWLYYTKSEAIIRCAAFLDFPWSLFRLLLILPASLRDFFYDIIG